MDAGDIPDLLRQAVYVQQVKISLYAAKEALAEYITKPRGRKMKGLGRHYSSAERRVVRGHCQFSGLYVLLGRRCPLLPRLYRQKAVCEQEQVPFQSKIDLAVQEIEQFQPVAGTHTHVLIDS